MKSWASNQSLVTCKASTCTIQLPNCNLRTAFYLLGDTRDQASYIQSNSSLAELHPLKGILLDTIHQLSTTLLSYSEGLMGLGWTEGLTVALSWPQVLTSTEGALKKEKKFLVIKSKSNFFSELCIFFLLFLGGSLWENLAHTSC